MPSLTDSCLRGLMQLIQTSKREDMVAESVVVVRALVQQAIAYSITRLLLYLCLRYLLVYQSMSVLLVCVSVYESMSV
jgi:hypothetical protein